ncbi:hypothetical protein ACIRG5_19100 [Lentzea sp. NPDC102401]|uniref:hypothetical protein n=1 Tax=Lentzea sp. NPDC102401 TaxID=3364128 RepID=UPI003829E5D3
MKQALTSAWPQERKIYPPRPSRLDPFKPAIDTMLREDLRAPRKQRHTVKQGEISPPSQRLLAVELGHGEHGGDDHGDERREVCRVQILASDTGGPLTGGPTVQKHARARQLLCTRMPTVPACRHPHSQYSITSGHIDPQGQLGCLWLDVVLLC